MPFPSSDVTSHEALRVAFVVARALLVAERYTNKNLEDEDFVSEHTSLLLITGRDAVRWLVSVWKPCFYQPSHREDRGWRRSWPAGVRFIPHMFNLLFS